MEKKTKLIVALDVDTLEDAKRLVETLYPDVELYKIGSQLFTAYGPQALEMVREAGGRVFLDLKFHDIPNTVASAVRSAAVLDVFMLTVHTAGGEEMMRAAADAARRKAGEGPKIVGVTVLTSDAAAGNTRQVVVGRALSAQSAGLDGVVCSVQEAAAARQACGKDFIIVTPGIRLPEGDRGDQKRVATPADAVAAGSNFLVVGRPVVAAADPLKAARDILRSL
jgi:orotidine-5'-phosphate decarboxylase